MLNFGNKEFRNLQEQVLKNAQDIETLKGRENLHIAIVNELPEVGNPNYIYLLAKDDGESPDVYDEYIWLEDEERYELIGGVSIDLTNYVTLDTAQTITGEKTFTNSNYIEYNKFQYFYADEEHSQYVLAITNPGYFIRIARYSNYGSSLTGGVDIAGSNMSPAVTNSYDLGRTNATWKDFYLSGSIDFGNNATITKDSTNRINLWFNNIATFILGGSGGYGYVKYNFCPDPNGILDLGRSTYQWKDLYLSGNITDGVNTVSVANIASKVTSTFISGTFDANGESTIDTEQEGTPEGLFIFTYGNCQCFLRLNATMVNSADVTPIRIACPMIYNSDPVNGWLNITKAGTILILTITDGTNHVDSGYSWTLTKTNLL